MLAQSSRITMLLSGCCAGAILMFAGPLIALVYGPDFAAAESLVRILAVAGLFASLRYVLGDGLRGLGQHRGATRAEVVGYLAGGLALLACVPLWGTTGIALAVTASYGATFVAVLLLTVRAGMRPSAALLPGRGDLETGLKVLRSLGRNRMAAASSSTDDQVSEDDE